MPLVTAFNPTLPHICSILKSRWNIISYKRSKNLRDMIGNNNIINSKVARYFKLNKQHEIQFCRPFKTSKCLCCKQLKLTNPFKSSKTNKTYQIFHATNCERKFVVYLLECKKCELQYVGEWEWKLNICLKNYRLHIENNAINKLLQVEKMSFFSVIISNTMLYTPW